jgi:hypothetical protein
MGWGGSCERRRGEGGDDEVVIGEEESADGWSSGCCETIMTGGLHERLWCNTPTSHQVGAT